MSSALDNRSLTVAAQNERIRAARVSKRYVCIHAPDAAVVARSFSPWVEMIDESTAVFTVTQRQLAQIPANIPLAVASTVETAILAARNFPGQTIIPPGEEARVLGSLSIDCLPPDPQIFQTLDLWGVRSLSDLARLPEGGLAARLGSRGLWLQKLARGALDRPLRPEHIETIYEESAEFDHPIELREPLLFLLGQFLFNLTAKLRAQSLAAGVLVITLNKQERSLRLPFPTRDVKFLLKLIEHSLERQPPEEPVELVHFRIEPVEPRRVQHGLFTLAAPEPEKLELTLGKIRGLVGVENVLYPHLQNTHRPGCGDNDAPRYGFRYFSPPLEARVEPTQGQPKQLWTRLVQGRIVNIAGPWRSSGDWWRPLGDGAWNRDEFDLLLSDGALYRLVRDRSARKWLLEGAYD
jgi:protein ImuB